MANPYTPFNDEVKEDLITTIKYMAELKSKIESLKNELSKCETWVKETLGLNETEPGTTHYGDKNGVSVTFEVSPTYKVNDKALQELVEEKQVSVETVDRLFSWTPKLNGKEWKATDEDTQKALSSAITTTYGKPSMKIEIKEN